MINRVSVNELRARYDPLLSPPWNQIRKGGPITPEEIARAVQNSALDEPGQTWSRPCNSWTWEETSKRENHVMRIAYFVRHREAATPIVLKVSGSMYDGYHRLGAAIYCGDEFIEASTHIAKGVSV